MSLFAISDLHLSLSSNKPMDIFKGWTDYVSRLQKNWNLVVKDTDTVVIPGDISWAMNMDDTFEDFKFINNLPGKKLILKGNHDYWWTTLKKMKENLETNGFDTIDFIHNNTFTVENACICGTRGWFYDSDDDNSKVLQREAARLETSIHAAKNLGLEPIAFLHYPPLTKDIVCEEIFSVLKEHDIRRCFYGHIHGAGCHNAVNGIYDGIDFKLVSCDFLEFLPLKIQ